MKKKDLFGVAQETEVIDVCQELIRLKSVNPPGEELFAAQYVASILERAGLEVELMKHSSTRATVFSRLRSQGKIPALLINGHLDTVPVGVGGWTHKPFDANIAERKIWGRGAADMRGG